MLTNGNNLRRNYFIDSYRQSAVFRCFEERQNLKYEQFLKRF